MDMTQWFSNQNLDQLARDCGLVIRQSPITGFKFLLTLTTGLLNTPDGTLAQLAAFLASACETHVSPQAIDERFGVSAVVFMTRCFETALQLVRKARAADLGMLTGFDHIYIIDSTGFDLHPSLSEKFKGSGGSGSKSTLRIQLALDYLTGRVHLKLGDVRSGDAPTLLGLVSGDALDLTGKCLFIADLGYFKLDTFKTIHSKDMLFLSKFMPTVKLQTADGTPLDLTAVLKKKPKSFSMAVRINECDYRITGHCLPDKQFQARLRKANKTSAGKGRKQITAAYRLFLRYAIFLTNLPESFSMDALYVLYRVRWQIELVFKTWKSILGIHKIRSAKYERVMCEVYGKLIIAVLSSLLAAQAEFDSPTAISLHRTMQWIKTVAMPWANAIVSGAPALNAFVAQQITNIQRFCKKHRQKNKPTIELRLQQFEPLGKRRTIPIETDYAIHGLA